jgi:hypothetical protein
MNYEIINCVQGTPEWFEARKGIPTASEFSTVMAKGKGGGESIGRTKYMRQLAGERLTGRPMESYSNGHMERGQQQEDEARELYCFVNEAKVRRVGFVKNHELRAGCSPDSLVLRPGYTDGKNDPLNPFIRGLEIKSAAAHIQLERLERIGKLDPLPPEHKAQVQGGIWLCELDGWDFMSYCPDMKPVMLPIPRDDEYIAIMAAEVERFNEELERLVQKYRMH